MDKLTDYIRWLGDFDFDVLPFREADALILCVISYFDLSSVFEGKEHPLVSDCLPMIEAGEARLCITGGDMGHGEIFELAARSKRFGNLWLSDYSDILKPEEALQFAAVTFHDRDRFTFLAYRGTDSTLAGWQEDFMIAFTRTTAQKMAVAYAEKVLAKTASGDIYIGGHSKGGNQALYASCMLPDDLWEKVTHAYLLDGPGLCPEVLDVKLVERIDPKATRIIPVYDVIGKLFEPKITDTRIIESSLKGFLQHALSSWMISYGDLALAEKNDARSLWASAAVNNWVASLSQEERMVFIEEFFGALGKAGKESLDDMKPEHFLSALISLGETSETTRQALLNLPKWVFSEETLQDLDNSLASHPLEGAKKWLQEKRADLAAALEMASGHQHF